ncbi:hypothetical protein [Nocardia abscessus]|uniref:hypothetical protein n=1 Tax=Nocardia abscessus TaxID=120957 RepID=UPI0002D3149F|nr:hypothetical protein [Nocardia abscessus]MCC3333534.1 hypothetical protein [Nocardia abscessus]
MAAREPWFRPYEAAAERADRRHAEELPVHELALASAAEHWFEAMTPFSLLDTVAEAMGDDDA